MKATKKVTPALGGLDKKKNLEIKYDKRKGCIKLTLLFLSKEIECDPEKIRKIKKDLEIFVDSFEDKLKNLQEICKKIIDNY